MAPDDSEKEWSDPLIPIFDEQEQFKYQKQAPTLRKNGTNHPGLSVNLIPEKYRSIFRFPNFNPMQSSSFDAIYHSDDNCVISSPAGSGKTVLFEMAIIKLLEARSHQSDDALLNAKILYVAPTKALCNERYTDWFSKFQSLNCIVGLLTGDSPFVELDFIRKSDLIICTPEKWDILTRRWADHSKILNLVKLLLVDEIHVLRERRGTSLEVVITRMMTMPLNLRVIALSATVPNINDVAKWLGKSHSRKGLSHATTLVYDDTYRAVTLKKTVYGYQTLGMSNPFKFDGFLNGKLAEVIRLHSKGKPILIFCSTRNNTITTTKYLLQGLPARDVVLRNVPSGISKDLLEVAQKGIAYHHAGLNLVERKFIEENFINGNLKILCSTSTLAVGVNLPAYLVIIKGTKVWNNNAMEEYNELDLMQMIGRAGRPQFETKGACVIMTDAHNKERYVRLVKGTENLESSLHLNIYENITAEITLKTITSFDTALNWLKSTFFYQRYLQNPTAYPTIYSKTDLSDGLEVHLKVFLKKILDELQKEKMIETDNNSFNSTVYGVTMSKSYVLFDTMKKFVKSEGKISLQESLLLVSKSDEFSDIRIKMAEKKLFKEINNSPLIYYPIKGNKIEKFYDKVSLLIQFELGGLEYPMYQGSMKLHREFVSEKLMVFKNLPRILKAAIEVFSHKKDSTSLTSILKLARCIFAKSWENSFLILRQFDGIGLSSAEKLKSRGITDITQIKGLPCDKLEYYLGLKPGAGQKISKSVASMPELSLIVDNVKCESSGDVQFTVAVSLVNKGDDIQFIWNGTFTNINVLTDVSGKIWNFQRLPMQSLFGVKRFNMKVTLQYKTDYIKVFLNCDEIAGIGKVVELDTGAATNWLDSKSSVGKQDPFNFDDDNEILEIVFGAATSNKNSDKVSLGNDISKPENQDATELSDTSLSCLSTSADSSFSKCAHRCSDKSTCRHMCCKEGIFKQKVKMCKHVCKDKSKCRHLCCRDQHEYETKFPNRIERKRLRQNTFNFSKSSNRKKLKSRVQDVTNVLENNIGPGDNELKKPCHSIENENKNENLPASCHTTKVPIFLRKIRKTIPVSIVSESNHDTFKNNCTNKSSKLTYGKLTTSKSFTTSIGVADGCNNRGLLDMSDSDEFSDTFESAISKAFEKQKRIKPIPKNDSSNKQLARYSSKCIETIGSKVTNNLEYPNLYKVEDSENARHFDSVEDIVILNQTLPRTAPIQKFYRQFDNFECNKVSNVDNVKTNGEEVEESNNGHIAEDITVMTSLIEDTIDKELFEFLDSDIEFDSL